MAQPKRQQYAVAVSAKAMKLFGIDTDQLIKEFLGKFSPGLHTSYNSKIQQTMNDRETWRQTFYSTCMKL